MVEKVDKALHWIMSILENEGISYQIVGGMAAYIHGGKRPIADIDLYIRQSDADTLLNRVEPYISKPLKRYVEGAWNLEYFQLIYQQQKIEVGLSPGAKIWDKTSQQWVDQTIVFSDSVIGFYHNLEVPVMPRDTLIKYKSILGREVDLIDIAEISDCSKDN